MVGMTMCASYFMLSASRKYYLVDKRTGLQLPQHSQCGACCFSTYGVTGFESAV
jgi:hypothetical protein